MNITNKSPELSRRRSGRPTKSPTHEPEQGINESTEGVCRRSSHAIYDSNACIVCQSREGTLHRVETTCTGKTIFECAALVKDKSVEFRLNSLSNPTGDVANDVMNHLVCYVDLKRKAGK